MDYFFSTLFGKLKIFVISKIGTILANVEEKCLGKNYLQLYSIGWCVGANPSSNHWSDLWTAHPRWKHNLKFSFKTPILLTLAHSRQVFPFSCVNDFSKSLSVTPFSKVGVSISFQKQCCRSLLPLVATVTVASKAVYDLDAEWRSEILSLIYNGMQSFWMKFCERKTSLLSTY